MIHKNNIVVKRQADGARLIYNGSILVEQTLDVPSDALVRVANRSSWPTMSFDSTAATINIDTAINNTTDIYSDSPGLDTQMLRTMRDRVYDEVYGETRSALLELLNLNAQGLEPGARGRVRVIREQLAMAGLI